ASARSELAKKGLESTLTQVGIKAGVDDRALPDFLRRGLDIFHFEDGKVVAKGADGAPVYRGGEPMTPESWLAGLPTEAPHLFKPSKGGGANPTPGGGGNNGAVRTIAAGSTLTAQ